jgi:hypothetical protein
LPALTSRTYSPFPFQNSFGWPNNAISINTESATGFNEGFMTSLTQATVVPEPIGSTLFIVGGATLGFRRFRKKFRK